MCDVFDRVIMVNISIIVIIVKNATSQTKRIKFDAIKIIRQSSSKYLQPAFLCARSRTLAKTGTILRINKTIGK